jgi:hypothetical protein
VPGSVEISRAARLELPESSFTPEQFTGWDPQRKGLFDEDVDDDFRAGRRCPRIRECVCIGAAEQQ